MLRQLRRGLVLVAALAAPVHAGEDPRSATVVVVVHSPSESARQLIAGLRQRLEEADVHDVHEFALTDHNEQEVAAAVRGKGARVAVAVGPRALRLLQRDVPELPVVSAMLYRAQEVTAGSSGVALEFPLDVELDWIAKILPARGRRVGVLYDPVKNGRMIARATAVAAEHGLTLVPRPVRSPAELPHALSSLTGTADVLWGLADDLVITPETAKSILLHSMRSRLPIIGQSLPWVRAGALFALDRDYADIGAQSAECVLRQLGASDRAACQSHPRRVIYAVNRRTAELMDIKLSAETLRNAAEVVR